VSAVATLPFFRFNEFTSNTRIFPRVRVELGALGVLYSEIPAFETHLLSSSAAQFICGCLQLQRLRFTRRHALPPPRHVSQTLQTVGVAFECGGAVPCICPEKGGG